MARNSVQGPHGPSLAPYSKEPVSTLGVTTNRLGHMQYFLGHRPGPQPLGELSWKLREERLAPCGEGIVQIPPTAQLPPPTALSVTIRFKERRQ